MQFFDFSLVFLARKLINFHDFRSETPVSAMGEDSNQSAMSDSQDATDFANKINPSSSGPTPTLKDPQAKE